MTIEVKKKIRRNWAWLVRYSDLQSLWVTVRNFALSASPDTETKSWPYEVGLVKLQHQFFNEILHFDYIFPTISFVSMRKPILIRIYNIIP